GRLTLGRRLGGGSGGARLRRGRSGGRSRGARLGQLRSLLILGLRAAGDAVLELAHAVAERFPQLREPLGSEDQEHDEQDYRRIDEGITEHGEPPPARGSEG